MKSQNGRDGASTIAHGLTDKKDMAESKLEHEEEYTSRYIQTNLEYNKIIGLTRLRNRSSKSGKS